MPLVNKTYHSFPASRTGVSGPPLPLPPASPQPCSPQQGNAPPRTHAPKGVPTWAVVPC